MTTETEYREWCDAEAAIEFALYGERSMGEVYDVIIAWRNGDLHKFPSYQKWWDEHNTE